MFNRKIKKRKRQFVNSIIYIGKRAVFMLKCLSGKSLAGESNHLKIKERKAEKFCP